MILTDWHSVKLRHLKKTFADLPNDNSGFVVNYRYSLPLPPQGHIFCSNSAS